MLHRPTWTYSSCSDTDGTCFFRKWPAGIKRPECHRCTEMLNNPKQGWAVWSGFPVSFVSSGHLLLWQRGGIGGLGSVTECRKWSNVDSDFQLTTLFKRNKRDLFEEQGHLKSQTKEKKVQLVLSYPVFVLCCLNLWEILDYCKATPQSFSKALASVNSSHFTTNIRILC